MSGTFGTVQLIQLSSFGQLASEGYPDEVIPMKKVCLSAFMTSM